MKKFVINISYSWGEEENPITFEAENKISAFEYMLDFMMKELKITVLENEELVELLKLHNIEVISKDGVMTDITGDKFKGLGILEAREKLVEELKKYDTNDVFIIGGASVYKQMLPYCDTAYITKVHCTIDSDTYFPNLDEDPAWCLSETLMAGQENGIGYEMCIYRRK